MVWIMDTSFGNKISKCLFLLSYYGLRFTEGSQGQKKKALTGCNQGITIMVCRQKGVQYFLEGTKVPAFQVNKACLLRPLSLACGFDFDPLL